MQSKDPVPLWAKLSADRTTWHSLVDHSADVAAVMLALLNQPTIASRIAKAGGLIDLSAGMRARLGALAFLHDFGKANRGFQARHDPDAPKVGHIDQVAWLFSANGASSLARVHEMLGLSRLEGWFEDDGAMEWLAAVLAHHGRPWHLSDPPASAQHWRVVGSDDPVARLASVRAALDRWFAPAFHDVPALPSRPAMIHAFAGLLMLADWLGSDRRFVFANGQDPDRWQFAKTTAAAILVDVGLDVGEHRQRLCAVDASFESAFHVVSPRQIQIQAVEPTARLVVLEAETGSGKTEAALWRFKRLFETGLVDGLYFALPTRVAASQMHARVMRFRDRVFGPGGPVVVLAVPGQVKADHVRGHALPDFGFEWSDDKAGGHDRTRWAAEHPKRFLAAQIAVGTIDQVLLGTVRTRHAHLRGSALLRHLLVVDEVHASDRYMGDLLAELLHWHVDAGGHALLLSATLGAGLRAKLLGTPCPDAVTAANAPYPMLSWAEAGCQQHREVPTEEKAAKCVTLEPQPIQSAPDLIARLAVDAAIQGAAVLVIRNTVGAAVEVIRAVETIVGLDSPLLFRAGDASTLHHGRFAASDRLLLDAAVEKALDPERDAGGQIVVGTQTLEQSLDLDADLLLTDLCPIDVLLQRIGRLHRHQRSSRPEGYDTARVLVLVPSDTRLDAYARRYGYGNERAYADKRILALTWQMMEIEPVWDIPAANRRLVERATHPDCLDAIEADLAISDPTWIRHGEQVVGNSIAAGQTALLVKLKRGASFSEFELAPEENVSSRLGLLDRQIDLGDVTGPFGIKPGFLRVPSWLIKGDEDGELHDVEAATGVIRFRIGASRLQYDRFGLMQGEP
jgi:CRISPR-associated endonuclease/helicase Cas3